MAGSQADFKYIDNQDRAWLLRIDRSNALSLGTGFMPIQTSDLPLDYLPRNVEPRYVIAKHPTRPIKREIYCQSINSDIWRAGQLTIPLEDYQDRTMQQFKIIKWISERKSYNVRVTDTYQNDNPN